MKTVKLFGIVVVSIVLVTSTTFAQTNGNGGVWPVYIPSITAELDSNQPTSVYTTVGTNKNIISPATSIAPGKVRTTGASEPCTDCGSGSSDCSAGSCGCQSGSCGGGCDCVGRSFFRRSGNGGPINLNVTRGADSNICDGCGSDNRTFLQRILPVTIKLRTNHCSRYVSFFGGWHDLEDYDGEGGGGGSRLIEFNDGYLLGFSRGKRYANNIRTEREITYRHNTNDSYSVGSFVGPDFVPTATFDSIQSVYSFSSMTNVLYDFNDLGTKTKPYIGMGLGGVYVEGDIETPALGRVDSINDSEFAYQLIAGATRKFGRDTEGYVEYRYFGSTKIGVLPVSGAPVNAGEFDYQSNNLVFGFRMTIPNCRCR